MGLDYSNDLDEYYNKEGKMGENDLQKGDVFLRSVTGEVIVWDKRRDRNFFFSQANFFPGEGDSTVLVAALPQLAVARRTDRALTGPEWFRCWCGWIGSDLLEDLRYEWDGGRRGRKRAKRAASCSDVQVFFFGFYSGGVRA